MIQDPMRTRRQIRELRKFCRAILRPNSVVAELGCFYGESTVEFARHSAKVYAIDSWDDSYLSSIKERADNAMSEVETIFDEMTHDSPKIIKIKANHQQARNSFVEASLDVVYIDIVHTEEATSQAIDLWIPTIREGGFIAGHDYVKEFPGVITAVDSRKGDLMLWGDGNWAWQV